MAKLMVSQTASVAAGIFSMMVVCPVCDGNPVYYAAPYWLPCGNCRGLGQVQGPFDPNFVPLDLDVEFDDGDDWGEVREISIFEGP